MDKSKWIAIEDRLPEVNVSVLVCGRARWTGDSPVISVASRGTKLWGDSWGDPARWYTDWIGGYECEWEMGVITHWQPLPDLPGE